MQCFSIWYASQGWPDRRIGGAREIRRVPSSILNPVAIDSKIWFAHNQATAESKVSVRGRRHLGLFSLGGLLGHNGEVKGYVDDVVYSPSHHATIVVFADGDNPTAIPQETAADAITVSIADVVLQNR